MEVSHVAGDTVKKKCLTLLETLRKRRRRSGSCWRHCEEEEVEMSNAAGDTMKKKCLTLLETL